MAKKPNVWWIGERLRNWGKWKKGGKKKHCICLGRLKISAYSLHPLVCVLLYLSATYCSRNLWEAKKGPLYCKNVVKNSWFCIVLPHGDARLWLGGLVHPSNHHVPSPFIFLESWTDSTVTMSIWRCHKNVYTNNLKDVWNLFSYIQD